MNCLSPLEMVNPRYKVLYRDLKENGVSDPCSVLFSKYNDVMVKIPCGRCEACLVRRANEWTFRIKQEAKVSKNVFFITLTYDEVNVPRRTIAIKGKDAWKRYLNGGDYYLFYRKDVPVPMKRDAQLFIKKLRKRFGTGLRYFLCSEYGEENSRPHYHMLLFNVPEKKYEWQTLQYLEDIIKECWNKGIIELSRATPERLVYSAKYCVSVLDLPKWYPKPFILASKRPMLGANFLNNPQVVEFYRNTLTSYGCDENGIRYPLSRVYKYKLFDADMRAKIYEQQLENAKDITQAERDGYKTKIRKKFKKSRVL